MDAVKAHVEYTKDVSFKHAILIDISTPWGSAEEVVSSLFIY